MTSEIKDKVKDNNNNDDESDHDSDDKDKELEQQQQEQQQRKEQEQQQQQEPSWPTAISIQTRDEIEKNKIKRDIVLEDLRVSIRYIIYTLLTLDNHHNPTLFESSFGVTRLCMSIEKLLTHELLSSYSLWSIIKAIQKHSPIISNSDFQDILRYPLLLTDQGRSRSFIRFLLNTNQVSLLFKYHNDIMNNINTIDGQDDNDDDGNTKRNNIVEKDMNIGEYYSKGSIMLDNEYVDVIIDILKKIDDTRFSLGLNSSLFDTLVDHSLLISSSLNQDHQSNNSSNQVNEVYQHHYQYKLSSTIKSNNIDSLNIDDQLKEFLTVDEDDSNNIKENLNQTNNNNIKEKVKVEVEEEEEEINFSDLLDQSFQTTSFKTNAFKMDPIPPIYNQDRENDSNKNYQDNNSDKNESDNSIENYRYSRLQYEFPSPSNSILKLPTNSFYGNHDDDDNEYELKDSNNLSTEPLSNQEKEDQSIKHKNDGDNSNSSLNTPKTTKVIKKVIKKKIKPLERDIVF
ncbi:hypothetical protein CYY_005466 [Polysphondylium violaceum]|uniref:RUN domain-containing protein n=1 Tax=Polysphondylium violaceum TaxID=133409 RepID=A0A8J4UYN1_9MYCE|nr:hypothetical protein CYY_005466 [Polysphondylium violaceum]